MCVIHRHGMGTEYTTSGCGRRPYHGKCADFQTSWFLFCGQNLAGTQTRCGIGIPKTSQVRIWCSDTFDLDWSPCAVLIRLLFRVPGTSSLSINASKHKRTRIGRAETASSNHCSKMTDDSTLLSLKVGVLNRGNNTSTNSSIKPWLGRWWWKPNMASWPNAPDLLAKCDDRQQWHTWGLVACWAWFSVKLKIIQKTFSCKAQASQGKKRAAVFFCNSSPKRALRLTLWGLLV